MDFSKLLHGFVKIDTWIFLSVYTDLLEVTYGFLNVVQWIYQNFYNDFSIHGFLQAVTWMC